MAELGSMKSIPDTDITATPEITENKLLRPYGASTSISQLDEIADKERQKFLQNKNQETANPQFTPQDSTQEPTMPAENTVSDFKQRLSAYKIANDRMMQTANPVPNEIDVDKEPYGYDKSDKMGMMGSLFLSGVLGAEDTGAAVAQKGAWGLEKLHLVKAGASDNFTDWYNRTRARESLLQNAMHAHPVIASIGHFAGGLIASSLALSAVLAALPEEIVGTGIVAAGGATAAKTAEEIAAIAPQIASKAGAAMTAIDGVIQKSIGEGAAKSILNSKRLSKAFGLVKAFGKGAFIGETQYDDENNHYLAQGIGGGLFALAVPPSIKFMGKFASAQARDILALCEKHNISLPTIPGVEKLASYMSFGFFKTMLQKRAAMLQDKAGSLMSSIQQPAKKVMLANLIDKESFLTKSLEKLKTDPSAAPSKITDFENRIKNVKELQDNIINNEVHVKNTFGRFLTGKLADSLQEGRSSVAKLNSSLDNLVPKDTVLDITSAKNEASKLLNDESSLFSSLRRKPLLAISQSLLSKEDPIGARLTQNGITDPEQLSAILNNILSKKGTPNLDPKIYKTLAPVMGDIQEALGNASVDPTQAEVLQVAQNILRGDNMSYGDMRANLTAIGRRIGSIGDLDGGYKRLYGALNSDLRKGLSDIGNPEALDIFDKQATVYRNRVAPFNEGILRHYRHDLADSDNFISHFLKPGNRNGVSLLLHQMPEGDKGASKLAAQAAVLTEAWERSKVEGAGINPMKFINSILGTEGSKAAGLAQTNDVIFDKKTLSVLNGYRHLLNVVNNISPEALEAKMAKGYRSGENISKEFWHKKTVLKMGALGGAAFGIMKYPSYSTWIVPVLMSFGAFAKVATSDAGRSLMMKLTKLGMKATSEEYSPIIQKVMNLILIPATGRVGSEAARISR